jgi:hypothetical protein
MRGHFCGCGSNFLLLALRIADSSRINRSAAAALFLSHHGSRRGNYRLRTSGALQGNSELCQRISALLPPWSMRTPERARRLSRSCALGRSTRRSGDYPLLDSDKPRSATPAFLNCPGELPPLIAAFDWSSTLVGPIELWPQSLKTITSFLLRSPVAMVLLWGPDGIMIYNNAYSTFAGRRHPNLLGSKVREGCRLQRKRHARRSCRRNARI